MAIFRHPPQPFVGGHQPDAPKTVSIQAAPAVAQSWDPNHTDSQVTLSNNNLTATLPFGTTTDRPTFGLVAKTSGKYYWEINTTIVTAANYGLGVGNVASTLLSYVGSETSSVSWVGSGPVFAGGPQVDTWAAYPTGSIVGFALDLDNHKLWGRVGASGNWNNDILANQNPATNTGGLALNAAVYAGSGAVPAGNLFNAGDALTAAFTSASWAGSAPSGFGPWAATSGATSWTVAGEIDGSGSVSGRANIWACAASEVDSAATIAARIFLLERLAGEIDGQGSVSANALRVCYAAAELDGAGSLRSYANIWALTGGKIDGAGSLSSYANIWGLLSGKIDGVGLAPANPLRVTFAGGEIDGAGNFNARAGIWALTGGKIDGAGSLSSYANIWALLRGEIDGAGSAPANPLRVTFAGGELDATAGIATGEVLVWFALRGEIDGAGTTSAAMPVLWARTAAKTDGAGSTSAGVPVLWARAAGEIDGVGSLSARANAWLTYSGLFGGAGASSANPLRVTYAFGEIDGAGAVSSYANVKGLVAGQLAGSAGASSYANAWLLLRGETDGTASIAGRVAGVVNWQVSGQIDAAGSVSGKAVLSLRASGVLAGSGTAAASQTLWAVSGGLMAGAGTAVANPLRATYAAAQAAATGTVSGAAALRLGLAAEADAQAAFIPGSLALRVGLAGEIDGVSLVTSTGSLIAAVGAEIDAAAGFVGEFAPPTNLILMGGEFNAFGGFSAGWQQFVHLGGRLSPIDRESDAPSFGRSSRTTTSRASLSTHFGRTTRLPRRNRGARA